MWYIAYYIMSYFIILYYITVYYIVLYYISSRYNLHLIHRIDSNHMNYLFVALNIVDTCHTCPRLMLIGKDGIAAGRPCWLDIEDCNKNI